MRVLVISDNNFLVTQIKMIVSKPDFQKFSFTYKFSTNKQNQTSDLSESFSPLNVKENSKWIVANFGLVISAHCKQIFPDDLVENIRCINVHPGLNPYNRGWYPQVFSIINGMPAGATIHEIDKELDNGPIIAQKEVLIESHDSSLSAYEKIQLAEIELLDKYLLQILNGEYETKAPAFQGNINLKKDFNEICRLDLDQIDTFENHLNKLRALTHGEYKNAYYFDSKGHKIFVSVNIQPESPTP